MCDYFCQSMENNQGDLTDIFRNNSVITTTDDSWHLPAAAFGPTADSFGDPFGGPLLDESAGGGSGKHGGGRAQKMLVGEEGKNNIFSRILQISPLTAEIVRPAVGDGGGGLQISTPRMQGIKRRKSLVKKVVCIPAPPAVSGKASGEVAPSDLWAWRKYGQKPIKGSPYPRGYYRCSSSKGCSARKQVERSRTDPNMLVITYTSEHNHPWPTQRNALAGSTRSQPSSKGNNASTSMNSPHSKNQLTNIKVVKEEEENVIEKTLVDIPQDDHDFDQVFDESFMMSNFSHPDNFFADLAELESDPMNLIFPKGFMGEHKLDEERERNKSMDQFNMFDWGGGNSLEEAKRGL